jgi:GNAT superfamily N-acetyltransferase
MNPARRAVAGDASELVRLRGLGFATGSTGWQPEATATLRKRLSGPEPTWAAFVVDQPGEPRLVACALGVIDDRLGWSDNPTGRFGYVFNVITDPGYRRLGYSRACMEGLVGWYREQEVSQVDLRASEQGEGLYRQLGFVRTPDPAMRLDLG